MIAISIEATGKDPRKSSLISIGAADTEDWSKCTFHEVCKPRPRSSIDPDFLDFYGYSEKEIRKRSRQKEKDLVEHFLNWIKSMAELPTVDNINLISYTLHDILFLEQIAKRYNLFNLLPPYWWRVGIDLHSILLFYSLAHGMNVQTGDQFFGDTSVERKTMFLNFKPGLERAGVFIEPYDQKSLKRAQGMARAYNFLERKLLPRR